MTPPNPAISLENVAVTLANTPILQDITAAIPAGQIIGLLGPSGAGKTTLIRTLLGLQKPTAGTVKVLDKRPTARQLRTQVGYVTQSPSVYGDLTVLENLHYFAALLGVTGDVPRVLEQVELQAHAHQITNSLSGGQRARVSLAVALLGKPRLLLLDEPTAGLDPVLRQDLWRQFRILADAGTTLLISSHVMDEAEQCDQVLFLRDGQLLINDTRGGILQHTKTTSMEAAFIALATDKKEHHEA